MNDKYENYPPELHPANYTMKGNPPRQDVVPQEQPDLSRLDDMTKEELIKLIKRVSGAMWGIGMMNPQDIANSMKLKLAHGGLTEKDMWKALPLMKEWFDRELGKAPQSIAMTVKDEGISKLSDDRLLRLEQELARSRGEEAIVISPLPQKLEDQSIS